MNVIKRDGTQVPFDESKIKNAVLKAMTATGLPSPSVADKVTKDVVKALKDNPEPDVETIQDLVEDRLMRRGLNAAAKAYILYRDEHTRARKSIKVCKQKESSSDVTDKSLLLVHSMSSNELAAWDRNRIVQKLRDTLGMDKVTAGAIAKTVEDKLIESELTTVSSGFIRELVNTVLMSMGYEGQLKDLTMYPVPRELLDNLMMTKSKENSNIVSNNPEAVSMTIADIVLKQYALDVIFSEDVRKAHYNASIYLHDLGYPHRVYCSSHSIEYLKKYGLKNLVNLNIESKPARSASVLTGHLNTFLASMQAYYAGALGLGFVNVFYAPMLIGMSASQMYQIAQELIFNGSQNAFSRGGQCLFLDYNVSTGIPSYYKQVPAIGPGGKYMFLANGKDMKDWEAMEERTVDGDWCLFYKDDMLLKEHDGKQEFLPCAYGKIVTYGDFETESRQFADALLSVWEAGDARGRVFEFPKCDFHVSAETFTDPEQLKVFNHACEVASVNGSPYFVFDRDSVSLSSCCRLKVTITDKSMLVHPEYLRTLGFQNVTINIPQAAYRAKHSGKGTLEGLIEEVDKTMDIAVKAHLQKKEFIAKLMDAPGKPLWQLGAIANDGRPYVDLKDAMYIIGLIGVNDAVHYLTGKEMHESDESLEMGLKLVGHMFLRCKEYSEKHGITFKIEESPAESAARRLAKADLKYYPEDAKLVYKGGDEDHAYYTNSIHLSADAPVELIERIVKQSMFNPIIEAGAIMHAFIGEEKPEPGAIAELVHKVFMRTQTAQLTISPEFTMCNDCGHNSRGLHETCPNCGSRNVEGETRIVGYFSKIKSWNASKCAELVARHNGLYAVSEAGK